MDNVGHFARSADILVCGSWGLSSPLRGRNTVLESTVNPQNKNVCATPLSRSRAQTAGFALFWLPSAMKYGLLVFIAYDLLPTVKRPSGRGMEEAHPKVITIIEKRTCKKK